MQGRFYRGILTGFNDAFVIDAATRERLIEEDPNSAELIKPWVNGHEILKWRCAWSNEYLLWVPWHFPIEKFPAVYAHLQRFKDDLSRRPEVKDGRYEWYVLGRYGAEYHHEFPNKKIVYNETSKELHAYIDTEGRVINKTGFIILCDDEEYVLGIMNSLLMDYYYRHEFPTWGDPWKGGRVQFRGDRMSAVTIAAATPEQKSPITQRVQTILANPSSPDVPRLEAEIDELVFDLYNLTKTERQLVLAARTEPCEDEIAEENHDDTQTASAT